MDKSEITQILASYGITKEPSLIGEVHAAYSAWMNAADVEQRLQVVKDFMSHQYHAQDGSLDLVLAFTPVLFLENHGGILRHAILAIGLYGSKGKEIPSAARDYFLYLASASDKLQDRKWLIVSQLSQLIDGVSFDKYITLVRQLNEEEKKLVFKDLIGIAKDNVNLHFHYLLKELDATYVLPNTSRLRTFTAQWGKNGELVMMVD